MLQGDRLYWDGERKRSGHGASPRRVVGRVCLGREREREIRDLSVTARYTTCHSQVTPSRGWASRPAVCASVTRTVVCEWLAGCSYLARCLRIRSINYYNAPHTALLS